MSRSIPESDWKKFKIIHAALLEHFSQQTIVKIRALLDGPGSNHERYLKLWKLIERRDRQLARAFDDFRRSTALQQLGIMRGAGLLQDDDLAQFSEETQQVVETLASYYKGEARE